MAVGGLGSIQYLPFPSLQSTDVNLLVVRGLARSQWFIIWGPAIFVFSFNAMYPIAVEMFEPGLKWWTNWHCHPQSHTAKKKNKKMFSSLSLKYTKVLFPHLLITFPLSIPLSLCNTHIHTLKDISMISSTPPLCPLSAPLSCSLV